MKYTNNDIVKFFESICRDQYACKNSEWVIDDDEICDKFYDMISYLTNMNKIKWVNWDDWFNIKVCQIDKYGIKISCNSVKVQEVDNLTMKVTFMRFKHYENLVRDVHNYLNKGKYVIIDNKIYSKKSILSELDKFEYENIDIKNTDMLVIDKCNWYSEYKQGLVDEC